MILPFAAALLLGAAQPAEPDGSRTIGIVPPYRAEPAAPAWLRPVSHARARVACRHYVYEAYAGPGNRWLVRYLPLPSGEAAEPVHWLLFTGGPDQAPQAPPPAEVALAEREARWGGFAFVLVDKRDLMRP